MKSGKKILLGTMIWAVIVTAAHLWLNFNWVVALNDWLPPNKRKFNVAYIPVT